MLDQEHPLKPLVSSWLQKLKFAEDHKKRTFQETADECMSFYNGPHNFMWDSAYMRGSRGFLARADGDEETIAPTFRFSMNKVAELVQLYGPSLYHRNPVRVVNPVKRVELPPEVLASIIQNSIAQQTDDPQAMAMQGQMQMQLFEQ